MNKKGKESPPNFFYNSCQSITVGNLSNKQQCFNVSSNCLTLFLVNSKGHKTRGSRSFLTASATRMESLIFSLARFLVSRLTMRPELKGTTCQNALLLPIATWVWEFITVGESWDVGCQAKGLNKHRCLHLLVDLSSTTHESAQHCITKEVILKCSGGKNAPCYIIWYISYLPFLCAN